MTEATDLDTWIERQRCYCIAAMERAISATHLVRRREVFGQVVIPAVGSVLASPEFADWNPEPDYFFHWLRDSAIVMRTVAELMHDAESKTERERWRKHFDDFVCFSLTLASLSGATFLKNNQYRQATLPKYRGLLRPEVEIRALVGDQLFGEPRFNPDGTIDVLRWARPQYDGPALRALACLRFLAGAGPLTRELESLLRMDLDFTCRHAGRACIGPWEEEGQIAHHYYVAVVQLGALVHGRAWAGEAVAEWDAAESRIRSGLQQHWSEQHQVYAAIRPASAGSADDLLDAATLLAVLDADLPEGPHSIQDIRVHQTQAAIECMFARELPLNRAWPRDYGPALGRSRVDRYFGGGAWYVTTLSAAAIYYRLAQFRGQNRDAWRERGDAFLKTVRAMTPADGALSEQVDLTTGVPTSARHLSWSYAAFISTVRLRAQTLKSK